MVNGIQVGFFFLSRGIRQDCPISPFLFLLRLTLIRLSAVQKERLTLGCREIYPFMVTSYCLNLKVCQDLCIALFVPNTFTKEVDMLLFDF